MMAGYGPRHYGRLGLTKRTPHDPPTQERRRETERDRAVLVQGGQARGGRLLAVDGRAQRWLSTVLRQPARWRPDGASTPVLIRDCPWTDPAWRCGPTHLRHAT